MVGVVPLGMSVLYKYVLAAYFAYGDIFCIFQQSAHIASFFPHKLPFFDGNFNVVSVSITYFE